MGDIALRTFLSHPWTLFQLSLFRRSYKALYLGVCLMSSTFSNFWVSAHMPFTNIAFTLWQNSVLSNTVNIFIRREKAFLRVFSRHQWFFCLSTVFCLPIGYLCPRDFSLQVRQSGTVTSVFITACLCSRSALRSFLPLTASQLFFRCIYAWKVRYLLAHQIPKNHLYVCSSQWQQSIQTRYQRHFKYYHRIYAWTALSLFLSRCSSGTNSSMLKSFVFARFTTLPSIIIPYAKKPSITGLFRQTKSWNISVLRLSLYLKQLKIKFLILISSHFSLKNSKKSSQLCLQPHF